MSDKPPHTHMYSQNNYGLDAHKECGFETRLYPSIEYHPHLLNLAFELMVFIGHGENIWIFTKFNKKSIQDRQIDTLIGLSKGLTADGKINQEEAEYLQTWLVKNGLNLVGVSLKALTQERHH